MINKDLERGSGSLQIERNEKRKPSIELNSVKSHNTFIEKDVPLQKNQSLNSKWKLALSLSKQSGSQKDIILAKKTLPIDTQPADLKTAKIEELRKLMGGPTASRLLGKSQQNLRQEKKGVVKMCLESISQWLKSGCSGCFRRFRGKRRQKQSNTKTNKWGQQPSQEGNSPHANNNIKRRKGLLGSSSSEINKERNDMDETAGGSSKDRRNSSMNSHIFSDQDEVQEEIAEIREVIRVMSKEKMMEKGQRHLIDALLYRTVRHDLDGDTQRHKITLIIWKFQNSSIWNDFLLLLGWVYILMSFFEPANRKDNSLSFNSFAVMIGIETSILTLQTLDLTMELIQRSIQENLTFWNELIKRKKNFFRLLFFLLNISDLLYYSLSYPNNTMRFARVIRPLQIIIFSKSLRRNFQGIISSAKNLIMILFLYIIITFLWAYIGVNMIGDLYNDENLDTYAMDFRDIFKASNVMYIFSTLDLYPDILFPAVESSYLYLLYFIPYLVMFLLLFAPIPVAVVYEGFRKHRLNILVADRIKRRKALWACFQCIVSDTKQPYIRKKEFVEFFSFVYSKVELEEASQLISEVLWQELDSNDNKKVTIEEFFNVIDITEQRHEFRLQRVKAFKWWVGFRDFIEQKFNLQEFILGKTFANVSLIVTLASCSLTIWGLFLDDTSDTQAVFDNLDIVFFSFFCLEIVLKMVAFGPSNFFNESWNNFDFFLVVFQGFFNYVFVSFMKGTNVKSLSAGRVLKIAKLQKIFRMFRAFRTVKVLNYILSGLDIIHKVYEILYKIVICIPIVMKLSVICVIVFYIYAAIGVEIFSANLFAAETLSQYGQSLCAPETPGEFFNSCEYSNFNTFGGAVLILLQVCVGSGWGYLQFDYAKKYDLMVLSSFYFNSFHFLSVFVLSLIGGLVWEVFDVVERIMRDQQAYEQQLEVQRKWEEQQQLLEGSFQSVDVSKKGLNTSKKRASIQQSMASIAMMKLPKLNQKFHLNYVGSDLKELDEEEEDDDESEKRQQQDKNIKTNQPDNNHQVKINHVMEKMLKNAVLYRHENFTDVINKIDGVHGTQLGNAGQVAHQVGIVEQGHFNSQYGSQQQQQEPSHDEDDDYDDDEDGETDSDDEEQDEYLHGDSEQIHINNPANQEIPNQSSDSRQQIVGIISPSQKILSPSLKQSTYGSPAGGLPKRKRRRKRQHSIELKNVIETKCAIDNPMISQRDRSQLILFQEVFKMSTIDAFFVNRTLKDPEQVEQITKDENDGNKEVQKQNVHLQTAGVELKTANFGVIKEEEEEYYEHNKTNTSQNLSVKKKIGLIQHPSGVQDATSNNAAARNDKKFGQAKEGQNSIHQDNIIIHSLENQIKDSPTNNQDYAHDNLLNSYDDLKKQFDTPSSIQNFTGNPMIEGFQLIDKILSEDGNKKEGKSQHYQAILKPGKNAEEFNSKKIISTGLIEEGNQNHQRTSEIGVFSAHAIPTELNDIPLKNISSSEQIEQDSKNENASSKLIPRNKRRMQQQQNQLEISPIHSIPQGQNRKQNRTETQASTFYTPYSSAFADLTRKYEESSGQLILTNNNNGHSNSSISKQTKESSNNPLIDDEGYNIDEDNTQISKKKNHNENINSQFQVPHPQQSHLANKPGPSFEQQIQPMPEQKDLNEEGILVTERSNQISSGNMIIETYLETVSGGNDKQNNEQFFDRVKGTSENKVGNNQGKYISKVALESKEKLSNSDIIISEEHNTNQQEDENQNLDGSLIPEISDIHVDTRQDKQTHLNYDHQLPLNSAISNNKDLLSKKDLREHKQVLREKKKQTKLLEIQNFYKVNLVEIEDGVDSQKILFTGQNTPNGKQRHSQYTSLQMAGSKSRSSEQYKGLQRDIIKDAPQSKLLKGQLNNINQDLRNQQQFQLRIDLTNMNYIINKAILKSVNIEKIHSIEMRHFRQLYGSSFENLLDNEILMLWNQQSKLLFHFDNLFKYDYAPIETFIQLYAGLEMQISSFLMNKFSTFKIIFQDQDDSWFTINYAHESYLLQEVENHGPWQHFDALFEGKDPKKLLKHRSIYAGTDQTLNIKKELKKYFQISQDISNNYFFRKLQINQKRSDTIYIPFWNDKIDDTQQKVLDFLSSGTTLPEYIMKDDLKLQWIPKIKKGLVVVHLFDNPIVKDRRRQFTSEILNIEQAIVEDDIIAQEQRNATLNYTQSIEFLKDIRTHINTNKEALFTKISSFYFYRSCFEKNFCDMSEVPFEQSLDE